MFRWWMTVFLVLITGFISADEGTLAPFRDRLKASGFFENDESRRLESNSIMSVSYPILESPFRIIRQITDGRSVQFEIRRGIEEWYLIFRNQRGEKPLDSYPLWGRGTWIIKKDLHTGELIQVKIFLQDDENSFVRIFPHDDGRSRIDVYLFGRRIGGDIIVPLSFESIMLAPFARIVALTEYSIDWALVFPNPSNPGYGYVEKFVDSLRPYADEIIEIDDAAVDGNGRNVFIENAKQLDVERLPLGTTGLNCSGYVKWVVDGIVSAWRGTPGGHYLDIKPLLNPTSRVNRNPWSASRSALNDDARKNLDMLLRDPWFGLDWNRNLAYSAEQARLGRELSVQEKKVLDTGEIFGISYRQDMGYSLEDLVPALYQLAADRPGAVYLAAVNSIFVPASSRDYPNPLPLHQYWHVSILAPWFDDDLNGQTGSFRVAVLDVGDVSESLFSRPGSEAEPLFLATIRQNAMRYAKLGRDANGDPLVPKIMVHLVRMDVPADYRPLPLPKALRGISQ